jgi:hypothetical protein
MLGIKVMYNWYFYVICIVPVVRFRVEFIDFIHVIDCTEDLYSSYNPVRNLHMCVGAAMISRILSQYSRNCGKIFVVWWCKTIVYHEGDIYDRCCIAMTTTAGHGPKTTTKTATAPATYDDYIHRTLDRVRPVEHPRLQQHQRPRQRNGWRIDVRWTPSKLKEEHQNREIMSRNSNFRTRSVFRTNIKL